MLKRLLSFFLALAIAFSVQAQETKEAIQKKQQQLTKELNDLNNTLAEIKKNKKQSISQLALVQKKINTRQALINNINNDLHRLTDDIYKNQLDIYRYKKELDTLKQKYAQSLVFAYKNRSNYDYLNFLFSATSFNDAVKRIAYLKSYRQYRETQVSNIVKTQQLLQGKVLTLTSNKTEKNSALGEQSKQLNVLESDKKEKDDVVKDLKGQESVIAVQIKNKEKARIKLNQNLQTVIRRELAEAKKLEQQRIAKLQEEERKRKLADQQEEERKKKIADQQKQPNVPVTNSNNNNTAVVAAPKNDPPKNNPPPKLVTVPKTNNRTYSAFESTPEGLTMSLNFESHRRALPWPVNAGMVITHFGTYEVTDHLKGVNDGITIAAPVGTTVKSVADGVVSAILDLGNTQAVVIKHGKYFTVYSNLSSVSVSKGNEVKSGTVVGRAGADDAGDGLVQFQIMNDKNAFMDPESWLKPR